MTIAEFRKEVKSIFDSLYNGTINNIDAAMKILELYKSVGVSFIGNETVCNACGDILKELSFEIDFVHPL